MPVHSFVINQNEGVFTKLYMGVFYKASEYNKDTAKSMISAGEACLKSEWLHAI